MAPVPDFGMVVVAVPGIAGVDSIPAADLVAAHLAEQVVALLAEVDMVVPVVDNRLVVDTVVVEGMAVVVAAAVCFFRI